MVDVECFVHNQQTIFGVREGSKSLLRRGVDSVCASKFIQNCTCGRGNEWHREFPKLSKRERKKTDKLRP